MMPKPKSVPPGKEQTLVIEGISSSGGGGQGDAREKHLMRVLPFQSLTQNRDVTLLSEKRGKHFRGHRHLDSKQIGVKFEMEVVFSTEAPCAVSLGTILILP